MTLPAENTPQTEKHEIHFSANLTVVSAPEVNKKLVAYLISYYLTKDEKFWVLELGSMNLLLGTCTLSSLVFNSPSSSNIFHT